MIYFHTFSAPFYLRPLSKYLLLVMVFSIEMLNGQTTSPQEYRESILKSINSLENEAKVESMIDLAYYYYDYVPDSAEHFALSALKEAQHMKYENGEITVFALLGSFHGMTGDYKTSKLYYEKALQQNSDVDNPIREAKLHDNLANVFINEGSYEDALKLKRKAFNIFQLEGDSSALCSSAMGLGVLFSGLDDQEGMMQYYQMAFNYARADREKAVSLGNLAVAYKQIGVLEKALKLYYQSLEYGKDLPIFQIRSYHNIAILLKEMGEVNQSNKILDDAIKLALNHSMDEEVSKIKIAQAFNFIYQENYKRADLVVKELLSKSIRTTSIQHQMQLIKLRMLVSQGLSKFEEAYTFASQYYILKDSLEDTEVKKELKDIMTKYQVSQKNEEIANQKLALELASASRKKLIWGFALLLSLFAVGIGTVLYLNRLKNRIAEKEQDLANEKILKLEQEKKMNSIMSMMEGQEKERERIARDLHDSIGGLLMNIKSLIAAEREAGSNDFLPMENSINLVGTELRRISHNLAPSDLINLGLKEVVEDLIVSYNGRENDKFEFHWVGEMLPFLEKRDLMLYRIVQELLANISKHANAQNVLLQVSHLTEEIQIICKDDGVGFDPLSSFVGMGLKNIASRVEYLDGSLDIFSKAGEGTIVEIQIIK